MNKTLEATLTLAGMIIGVGMFGVPFAFAAAGFWLGVLELLILTAVTLSLHLLYAEVVLETSAIHRLPGYIKTYLGPKFSALAWFSSFFGVSGSLLAYLLVGSAFLGNIFLFWGIEFNNFFWMIFIVVLVSAITFFPLRKESLINGILTILLIVFIFFLVAILLPRAELANFSGFNISEILFPYGVLLFALSGGIVIPDVVILAGRNRASSRKAIIIGSLLPAILYLLFVMAVIGVSGQAISEEALRGLRPFVGRGTMMLGSLVGFLAVFTSMVATSKYFQEMLKFDFKMPGRAAWVAVSVLPVLLYALGFQSFILIIGAIGAVGVGIDSGLIIAANHKLRRRLNRPTSYKSFWWKGGILLMIFVGVIYELYKFFGF